MGSVQIDIHKNEYPFKLITFSDIECIKGLIKFRWMIDTYYGMKRNFNLDEAGDVKPLNQELICIYADLDNLIAKCNFNKKQKYIIKQLMSGRSEKWIAKKFNQLPQRIYEAVNTIAMKIKNVNDKEWKYNYVYLNYLPVQWNYKKCVRCNEFKPKTRDFFGLDKRNSDGYQGICKECDNYRKKTLKK